jgi:hypothetical protein
MFGALELLPVFSARSFPSVITTSVVHDLQVLSNENQHGSKDVSMDSS